MIDSEEALNTIKNKEKKTSPYIPLPPFIEGMIASFEILSNQSLPPEDLYPGDFSFFLARSEINALKATSYIAESTLQFVRMENTPTHREIQTAMLTLRRAYDLLAPQEKKVNPFSDRFYDNIVKTINGIQNDINQEGYLSDKKKTIQQRLIKLFYQMTTETNKQHDAFHFCGYLLYWYYDIIFDEEISHFQTWGFPPPQEALNNQGLSNIQEIEDYFNRLEKKYDELKTQTDPDYIARVLSGKEDKE